ncbi:MAG: glycosyltransferase family 39 protein [Phycisphaerae bacterium]|nr:glycosyltransferase family 39 protein [Phycisphaerae bacterium]
MEKTADETLPSLGRDAPAALRTLTATRRFWIIFAIVAGSAVFRVGMLVRWRAELAPPDINSFASQAESLTYAFSSWTEDRWAAVDEWFHRHRKPPMFSGLMALLTVAGRHLGADVRMIEAAYCLAFVGGLWMLRPAWLILRRLGDERIALAGLALFAVSRIAVEFSAKPLSETLYAGLFLYSVEMLLCGLLYRRAGSDLLGRRVGAFLAAGVLAGLAFLTRSEALLLLPATLFLTVVAAIRRAMSWSEAIRAVLMFAVGLLLLAGPYVTMISLDDHKFTIRRNAGQLLAHEIGTTEQKSMPIGKGKTEAEVVGNHLGRILTRWPRNFFKAIANNTSQRSSYVGMFFVVAGLVRYRRELLAWGPWQICGTIYLLAVAQLSVFQPHGRWLLAPIGMLAPLMGLGAVALVDAIIKWNPAKMAEPRRASPPMLVGCVLAMCLASAAGLMRDRGRDDIADPPDKKPQTSQRASAQPGAGGRPHFLGVSSTTGAAGANLPGRNLALAT